LSEVTLKKPGIFPFSNSHIKSKKHIENQLQKIEKRALRSEGVQYRSPIPFKGTSRKILTYGYFDFNKRTNTVT